MPMRRPPTPSCASLFVWASALSFAFAAPVYALQPLEAFVRSARDHNFNVLEALANSDAQKGQWLTALGRALPQAQLRGTYTGNQYVSSVTLPPVSANAPALVVTIVPQDEWDAFAILNVPLVDLASFARIAAAGHNAESAVAQAEATSLAVEALVAQTFYQVVADLALTRASEHAVNVARKNLEITRAHVEAGDASRFDSSRARAELERTQQQLTAAELELSLAAKALETLTRITPALDVEAPLGTDLSEPPDLTSVIPNDLGTLPSVRTAVEGEENQRDLALSQTLAFAPTLSAVGTEHWTNAPGFVGYDHYWQALVAATWTVDLTLVGNRQTQQALASAAHDRLEQARLNALDDIHRAWRTVRANIVRSRSARVQRDVSDEASSLAQDRYETGAATQLDLLQAQRDAFTAAAASIQADADLANARAALRIARGKHLFEE
jgi:outer membrane protein TolC